MSISFHAQGDGSYNLDDEASINVSNTNGFKLLSALGYKPDVEFLCGGLEPLELKARCLNWLAAGHSDPATPMRPAGYLNERIAELSSLAHVALAASEGGEVVYA